MDNLLLKAPASYPGWCSLRHLNEILLARPEKELERYPRGPLARQLADIAAVIKAGEPLEISAVDYGGWDHHSRQGASTGQMARMLDHLAKSIAALTFFNELLCVGKRSRSKKRLPKRKGYPTTTFKIVKKPAAAAGCQIRRTIRKKK